jgi:fumarate hydratase class I
MPDFIHETMFPLAKGDTKWRKLTGDYVKTAEFGGAPVLSVDGAALTELSRAAFFDIAHYLRSSHLAQLAKIMDDPEASDNDRFVTYELLKNANISAGGILPMCQDTGTAIVMGKKGHRVMTLGDDEARLAEGVFRTFAEDNLRYSQLAPLSMYEEVNTFFNHTATTEIYTTEGRREDPHPGHRRLSALSPRHRHRRDLGGTDHEDREARELPLFGWPARGAQ